MITGLVTATVIDTVDVECMASLATQQRLTAARKRARERMTAERRQVEDLVMAFHRAALEVDDLGAQLTAAEARRSEAAQGLLSTGRTVEQVVDLLGVEVVDFEGGASARRRPRSTR